MRKFLCEDYLRSDADVRLFLAAMGTPILGTKVNCEQKDHVSPFRVVADIITMRVLYYIAWANRSGSKTFSLGGLPTWYKSIRYPRLETKILGGSKDQSKLSYDAMSYFFDITQTADEFLKYPGLTKQHATLKNNSEVSILTASTKSVRGPHPQILLLDEVDEMDNNVFQSALSQPQEKFGIPASLGMYSTNHVVNGLMDKALKNAAQKGHAVYKYCIFECIESCRDYSCSTCPISSVCPGKQIKKADGYYKIKDLGDKLNTLGMDEFQRDWLCIKVGYGDLIYQNEYDADIHLCGVSLRKDATVDLSLDWGGVDPFSAGVWQDAAKGDPKFPKGSVIRVTELYLTSHDRTMHNGIFIREAKKKPWWKLIKNVIYDNSRPDLAAQWIEELPNATFYGADRKSIDDGIEVVKSTLRPISGAPMVYINRICGDWRREVSMYRRKKISDTDYKIIDQNNHAMDETRYYLKWKFGRKEEGFFGVMDDHDISPR